MAQTCHHLNIQVYRLASVFLSAWIGFGMFERDKFNKRSQEVGESAENFITAVHKLAEHCKYGVLREELIRDRIVVGIRDAKLSKKMQLNQKLDLATAIVQVRQHEEVK